MARTWNENKFGYITLKDSLDETKSLDDSLFTASTHLSPAATFRRSLTPKVNIQDGFVKNTHTGNVLPKSKVLNSLPATPNASSRGQETSLFRYMFAVPLTTLTFTIFADTYLLSRSLRKKICLLLSLPCIFMLIRILFSYPYVADRIFHSKEVAVPQIPKSAGEKIIPSEDQWHHILEKKIHIILENKWKKLSEEMKNRGMELWQKTVQDQVKEILVSSKDTTKQVTQLKLDLQTELSEKSSYESTTMGHVKQLKIRLEHFEEKSKQLEELFLNHRTSCSKQADVNAQLNSMVQELKTNLSYLISYQNSVDSKCIGAGIVPSSDEIQKIIKASLNIYNSDKTGLVDYALESAGGSIVNVHGTETYAHGNTQFTIFGVPFWKARNSPRAIIQPQVHPGECWAMRGSAGSIIIRLFSTIRPTSFSLEHIPKNLAPMGIIDSAPKDFSVLGLTSDTDNDGHLFGTYSYTDGGDSLQTFHVQNPQQNVFDLVELRVHSNHGNSEFTCLYRFRVHGIQK